MSQSERCQSQRLQTLIYHRITELLSQLFGMIVQNRALRDQAIEREVSILAVDQATTPLASIAASSEPCTQVSERRVPQLGVEDLRSQNPGVTITDVPTIHVAKEGVPMANVEPQDAEASTRSHDVMQNFVARSTSRDAGPITE